MKGRQIRGFLGLRGIGLLTAGMLVVAAGYFAALSLVPESASATRPPTTVEDGCANGETFNPFEDECQPNGTKRDICHVAGLASDPANYLDLNIAVVAIFGPAGHFGENGTPNAGHEEDSYGLCNPPPFDECPNIPGNQEPGTDCEPQGDPVDVEAGVVFVDGSCDSLPFIDVLEVEGVVYTHDGMEVGDHTVDYGSAGTIVAHDEAEDDDVRLVGETEFEFAFTFDAAGCETPPPGGRWVCDPVTDKPIFVPVSEAHRYKATTPRNDEDGHCSNGDTPDDPPELPHTF